MDIIYHNTQLLIDAVKRGDAAGIQRLIPSSCPKYNNSDALKWAAVYGHTQCVKLLIPVSDPKAYNSNSLFMAAREGHTACVDLLFEVSDPQTVLHRLQEVFSNNPKKWQYLEEKILAQQQRDILNNEIAQHSVQPCMKTTRKI